MQEPEGSHHYLLCTVEPGGSFRLEKRDIPHVFDWDYAEYFLHVHFPSYCFAAFAGLLTVGGVSTGLGALKKKRARRQQRRL